MAQPIILRVLPHLNFGGVESRVVLQSALAKERGYELRVCTFASDGDAARAIRAEGVPVHVLGRPATLGDLRSTRALAHHLRRTNPALVHSSIVEANVHACLATLLTRTPLIVEEVGEPSHSLKARIVLRALYRVPRRIVGVSKVTCRYLVNQDGAPASRVDLIYNCAHPRFFPYPPPTVERPPRDITHFLVVGRLNKIKNQRRLLDALAIALKEGMRFRLDIVGDGEEDADLKSHTHELGLNEHVHFHGFRSDITDMMADADAFLLPSHSEGCSISLIESMASGLPALGSHVAGIVEVMGETAREWTFGALDIREMARVLHSFTRLSTDDRRALALKQQRRAYAEFSPSSYMDRLDALYRSALPTAGW